MIFFLDTIALQSCRSPFVSSFGTKKVLLMVLLDVYFATWRVNFPLGRQNFFGFYHPYVKDLGLQNACK